MEQAEHPSLLPSQLNPLLNPWIRGHLPPSEARKHVSFKFTDFRVNQTGDYAVMMLYPAHATRPQGCDRFDVRLENEKLIIESTGEPFHTADTGNVSFDGPSEFCRACYSALGYLTGRLQCLRQDLKQVDGRYERTDDGKVSVIHHWNVIALLVAASSGCPLCLILWSRCYSKLSKSFWAYPIELLWTSESSHVWVNDTSGCARLISSMSLGMGNPRHGTTYFNLFRFQLWRSPDCDRFFQHDLVQSVKLQSQSPRSSQLPRVRSSSTQACKPLAVEWLARCKSNVDRHHDACNAPHRTQWYPTRLLNLSDIKASGMVRVVSTSTFDNTPNNLGDYITLSHRWGFWGAENMQRLTKANLTGWQQDGISLVDLLPTFADAIEVAEWFKVRWLWIDCMCIIQDSVEDWDHEAALMSEIYRHAVLNISADGSRDARGGCFRPRSDSIVEPFKMRMPKMRATWWVTVDERSLFDWVETSPTSKRAWIYQERHLSRRVLHFTEHEVFWECCATVPSFACETYPQGPPFNRGFVNQTKLQLPCATGEIVRDSPELRGIWKKICAEYSTRSVSHKLDKLPALAALAQDVGEICPGDLYISGMWSSTLTQDLLWTVRHPCYVPEPHAGTEYIAPSWSWLSANLPVTMRSACNHHSIISILNLDYRALGKNRYGKIERAFLTVQAFIRPITVVSKPWIHKSDESGSSSFDYFVGDDIGEDDLYVDNERLNIENRIGWKTFMDTTFDELPDNGDKSTKIRTYYCLLLAVSQSWPWAERRLDGLLLEMAVEPNVYKRVGVISFSAECALKMRYKRQSRQRSGRTDSRGGSDDVDEGKAAWNQLWDRVSPTWGHRARSMAKPKRNFLAPVELSVRGTGPSSLYEFDDGVVVGDDADPTTTTMLSMMGFERLTPTVAKLI